jgi:hypothetical protein
LERRDPNNRLSPIVAIALTTRTMTVVDIKNVFYKLPVVAALA